MQLMELGSDVLWKQQALSDQFVLLHNPSQIAELSRQERTYQQTPSKKSNE